MRNASDISVWWHGIPALPSGREDQTYHALRRVWGDQTIAGARSFYRVGSEDNITLALFQNWALFESTDWVRGLVEAIGGSVGAVTKVRWAYACEEVLDAKLAPHHKQNFVIPDIMLLFEDEHGMGLVVIEVKRPGKAVEEGDVRKLKTYCDLRSTRHIKRRFGCFLVSAGRAEQCKIVCKEEWPVLTWETLGILQIAAARTAGWHSARAGHVAEWIARHYARHGIRLDTGGEVPPPVGNVYGSEESYARIDALPIPESARRFLKGSECVEAIARGEHPAPPLLWLVQEPSAEEIRRRRWQTTEDRRLCRWSPTWSRARERSWL